MNPWRRASSTSPIPASAADVSHAIATQLPAQATSAVPTLPLAPALLKRTLYHASPACQSAKRQRLLQQGQGAVVPRRPCPAAPGSASGCLLSAFLLWAETSTPPHPPSSTPSPLLPPASASDLHGHQAGQQETQRALAAHSRLCRNPTAASVVHATHEAAPCAPQRRACGLGRGRTGSFCGANYPSQPPPPTANCQPSPPCAAGAPRHPAHGPLCAHGPPQPYYPDPAPTTASSSRPPTVVLHRPVGLSLPADAAAEDWLLHTARRMGLCRTTTCRLALHVWRRTAPFVSLVCAVHAPALAPPPRRALGAGLAPAARAALELMSSHSTAAAATVTDCRTQRAYAAAALWLAAKLEEQRSAVPPAAALAAAAGARCAGVVAAAEVRLLEWVGWRPYEGYCRDDSHLLLGL